MILYEKPFRLELLGRTLLKDGEEWPFTTRKVSELKEVMMEPHLMGPEGIAYYMFRGVHQWENLRYDITVIEPRFYGDEYSKTLGHYHPPSKAGAAYPEVYQVLKGKASFVLQRKHKDESVDCITIEAGEKESFIIPPGYGHVSYNTGDSPLILANIVASFDSKYEEYMENHGPAFFCTRFGYKQNTYYIIKKQEKLVPRQINHRYGVMLGDLLEMFYNKPEKFDFLSDPSKLTPVL
ncbi:MAG: glucose-6-phosphate isomerase family protein [Candidatus Micrarchaeia archaeon]|jgi:glucose-6-phosphate isomerase